MANLTLPVRAAFYYPWFSQAPGWHGWSQSGYNLATHYHPALGFYDTGNATILAAHVAMMQYGKIQAAIASWWGQGSFEDQHFPLLLDAAAAVGFSICPYYEAEGNAVSGVTGSPNPTVAQLTSDLNYIKSKYASHPAYLHISGAPVIFAYGDGADTCDMFSRWHQANVAVGNAFYTNLKVFKGWQTCANPPAQVHQYGPASSQNVIVGHSFEVSPGFWKFNETSPRLVRDPAQFQTAVNAMVASKAPWQLVCSMNEWGEGHSVECAAEWQSPSGMGTYLDILHNN